MPAAVLVRLGSDLVLVPSQGEPRVLRVDSGSLDLLLQRSSKELPDLEEALKRLIAGSSDVAADDLLLASAAKAAGARRAALSLSARRAAREKARTLLGRPDPSAWLRFCERAVAMALSSPTETLISLAREEIRVERLLNREVGAADQFVPGEDQHTREYEQDSHRLRDTLLEHHRSLRLKVSAAAEAVAPNLSLVVGPLVAARLVAHAGGLDRLGRMPAATLQLLGAGKRVSTERRPRHGTIYGATKMADVPPARRGALARSLAALGVIAARADATTRSAIGAELARRRDRRVDQLLRQGK